MIYPAGLAVFYPHPKDNLTSWQAIAALLLLGVVSAAIYAARRRFPYAPVGWCWYLGMLAPLLGIIETGAQAHADRYTYLPQIGLYIMVAWGIADLSAKWDSRAEILGVAAGVAITCLLAFCAREQVSCWRDSVTLWNNAVECTGPNSVAETNLGNALLNKGRVDERSGPSPKSRGNRARPCGRACEPRQRPVAKGARGRGIRAIPPCAGNRAGSCKGAHQHGRGHAAGGTHWKRPSRNINGRWKSSPASPWRTTTWARHCGRQAG